ncbi:hypothetical protein [Mycobacterium avium]|uniref:hypothetical protein n=1 Tax=Mycobacterium avium TaxID=1764 RepID=UPI0015C4BD42|nr:hypothetical protein [Mycobacterium avium]
MVSALFIHYTEHSLHPSALDVVDVPDRIAIGERLNARPPGHTYVESFSATGIFGQLDFWFSPWPGLVPRQVNKPATELLLSASSTLRPKTVPLLRGRVLVLTHDTDGELAALTDEQIRAIALHANRWRGPLTLDWRYAADKRAQRRRRKADRAAQQRAFWDRIAALYGRGRAAGNE